MGTSDRARIRSNLVLMGIERSGIGGNHPALDRCCKLSQQLDWQVMRVDLRCALCDRADCTVGVSVSSGAAQEVVV